MVTIKERIANAANYGTKRDLSSIKFIVIHYTANDGDTDENNGKYFANNVVKSSAHYFVDDDSVTQSVPDDYVAWSVGGSRYSNYKTTGGAKYYNKATNSNTLNIEICDDVKNGSVYPSKKTIENAIELTKKKMKEYNVPASKVLRHFDVTGKACPAYWCGSTAKNNKWKTEFWNKLSTSTTAAKKTTTTTTKKTTTTAKKTTSSYYPMFRSSSIVEGLKSIGVDSGFVNRKKIAKANGISAYAGTATQNVKLLNLAKKGKLKKA